MRGSILFVCAANVCRSPLMQYAFLDAVADADEWEVASAGVSAREGARVCRLALPLVRSEAARSLAEAHRSARVDEARLQADLVIVASRAERAALARRSPEARWRVFTLSEAVFLGRYASTRCPAEPAQPGTVTRYAQLLDEQRGMLVLPRPKKQRRFPGLWEQPHPLDIADGHHRRRRAHTSTLRRVRVEVAELSSQLADFRDTSVH